MPAHRVSEHEANISLNHLGCIATPGFREFFPVRETSKFFPVRETSNFFSQRFNAATEDAYLAGVDSSRNLKTIGEACRPIAQSPEFLLGKKPPFGTHHHTA